MSITPKFSVEMGRSGAGSPSRVNPVAGTVSAFAPTALASIGPVGVDIFDTCDNVSLASGRALITIAAVISISLAMGAPVSDLALKEAPDDDDPPGEETSAMYWECDKSGSPSLGTDLESSSPTKWLGIILTYISRVGLRAFTEGSDGGVMQGLDNWLVTTLSWNAAVISNDLVGSAPAVTDARGEEFLDRPDTATTADVIGECVTDFTGCTVIISGTSDRCEFTRFIPTTGCSFIGDGTGNETSLTNGLSMILTGDFGVPFKRIAVAFNGDTGSP
jgi:hypothetical protein